MIEKSTSRKKKSIAIVHNLSTGGSLRYMIETNKIFSKNYTIKIFKPKDPLGHLRGIFKIINYLVYCYIYLPVYYLDLSVKLNRSAYVAVIVHHDTYIKAPTIFPTLKKRNVYIIHEPPREFYEPISLHAPRLADKLITLLRLPIFVIDKFVAKSANIVITNSKYSKKRVDQIYSINSKMIYPGLSKFFYRSKTKRLNQCLCVGSLLPYKGHNLAIDAISQIEKHKPNLIIVGSGRISEHKQLVLQSKRLKVNLNIIENPTDLELRHLYQTSKVYLNMAYQEPFGLSAAEALNSGCNLVTVNNCGTSELQNYCTDSVFVCERNPKIISKSIIKALKNSKTICPLSKYFSWENTARGITNLITDE